MGMHMVLCSCDKVLNNATGLVAWCGGYKTIKVVIKNTNDISRMVAF